MSCSLLFCLRVKWNLDSIAHFFNFSNLWLTLVKIRSWFSTSPNVFFQNSSYFTRGNFEDCIHLNLLGGWFFWSLLQYESYIKFTSLQGIYIFLCILECHVSRSTSRNSIQRYTFWIPSSIPQFYMAWGLRASHRTFFLRSYWECLGSHVATRY